MPANTVKVDRTTIWGNPFRVGDQVDAGHGTVEIKDAATAVVLFRDQLDRDGGYLGHTARRGSAHVWVSTDDIRRELRGKNLACWCRLGTPCHADVLLQLANAAQGEG
ncbi:DUF4326 domain-containing protein [Xylophilus rhododendri]|nr:DUF4326 domain-containing protein [Xylophilus rhododendri]